MTSIAVASPLQTIATVGQTQQIGNERPPIKHPVNTQAEIEKIVNEGLSARYKVKTPELSAGRVTTHERKDETISQPIAMVGCDDYSARWLKHYAVKFKAMNVVGFVVNCKDEAAYNQLAQQSSISLVPINGAGYAKRFDLQHYPVLITDKEIIQ